MSDRECLPPRWRNRHARIQIRDGRDREERMGHGREPLMVATRSRVAEVDCPKESMQLQKLAQGSGSDWPPGIDELLAGIYLPSFGKALSCCDHLPRCFIQIGRHLVKSERERSGLKRPREKLTASTSHPEDGIDDA